MRYWVCHYILYGKSLLEKQGLMLVGNQVSRFFKRQDR